MLPLRRGSLLLSALLLLSGCGKIKGLLGLDEQKAEANAKPTPEPKPAEPGPDAQEVEMPPEPLLRSDRKLRFPGKSGEHMGFNLAKLSGVHALAGAVEVPEWSSPGKGAARLVRDDDIRTIWTCELEPEKACAIGIHLPKPAEAVAIRLFADPSNGDHARPKRVRLHTDEGWAEARLPNEDGPWHVLLGEPVLTRNLVLELMETHGSAPVGFGELEAFGRSGTPRGPLPLDLTRRVVTFDAPVWRKKSSTNTPTNTAFIEEVDVDGHLRRLLPGTALVGQDGDRLMLLERARWSTCDDHQGAYQLLDMQTRVLVPLGDMGGFAGDVFRHTGGHGFAVGSIDGDEAAVEGIVIDDGHYERRSVSRLEKRSPKDLLADWTIASVPLSRDDARPLNDPPHGCGPARLEDLDTLRPSLPKRTKIVATQWYGCSLGGGTRLMVSTGGACGKTWHIAVLDPDGTVVGERSGKEPQTHMRLRRIDGETMLLELWGNKDKPRVLQADSGTLVELKGLAGFSLRPPQSCRARCDVEFDDLGRGE